MRRWSAGAAVPLFLLVLLLVHGTALLAADVILDNARQYGPPLVAHRLADAWLLAQPQVHYFHDATPRLFRWIIAALPLPVPLATKVYALVLLLPLAALAWSLARTLFRDPVRAATFAVLLLANAVFSNQMLTGTPRDLGTVLFLALLLALLQRRFALMLAALVPLMGIYPTFGLLALVMLWLALLPALARAPRRAVPLLLSLPLALLGLKGLGPTLDPTIWGPTFRLWDQRGFAALAGINPLHPPVEGFGPSVARLFGWQATPAQLVALLGDKRFRILPAAGEHAFGWLGSPSSILLLAALLAGLRLLWLLRRGQGPQLRTRLLDLRRRLAWPWRVFCALGLAALALFLLAFALAFQLHNPNRYGMMPAVLLLSLVEVSVLAPPAGVAAGWRRALLPWLLALLLPLLRAPVDPLPIPADALAAVAGQLTAPRPQLLVWSTGVPEHDPRRAQLSAIASALPLSEGVRVFYAEEMDRGFHLRAIREAQQLRQAQYQLSERLAQPDPRLRQDLEQRQVTHLLGGRQALAALPARPGCLRPIPGDLALLPTACLDAPP